MSWRAALGRALRSRAEVEAEVAAELEHHLECRVREGVARGLTQEEARAAALERFGDVESVRGACIELQTGAGTMLQRVHLAVTSILLVAVLVLAWTSYRSQSAATRAAEVAAALQAQLGARKAPAPVAHVIVEVGDRIRFIDELNPNEVKGVVEVALDGKIPVPEVGWVYVAGMTREELAQELTRLLSAYFVESKVSVDVKKPTTPFQSLMFDSF